MDIYYFCNAIIKITSHDYELNANNLITLIDNDELYCNNTLVGSGIRDKLKAGKEVGKLAFSKEGRKFAKDAIKEAAKKKAKEKAMEYGQKLSQLGDKYGNMDTFDIIKGMLEWFFKVIVFCLFLLILPIAPFVALSYYSFKRLKKYYNKHLYPL